jgi:hypothetical protein
MAAFLQYLLAAWVFWFPGASAQRRNALSPSHMASGICIYACGLVVCLVSSSLRPTFKQTLLVLVPTMFPLLCGVLAYAQDPIHCYLICPFARAPCT